MDNEFIIATEMSSIIAKTHPELAPIVGVDYLEVALDKILKYIKDLRLKAGLQ